MGSCTDCLFYSKDFSEFLAMHVDSTPENEVQKEYFCQIYHDGIPDEIWEKRKDCVHHFPKQQK